MLQIGSKINLLNPRVILVVGMHRSGTSAVTRGLDVLGVNLGTRLRSPRAENQKGFWEDLDFNAINTDVLHALGHHWHTTARIDESALRSSIPMELKSRAKAFVEKKISISGIIGLKDPRATRILPFWEEIFDEFGIDLRYVVVCRNPLSVARSLAARDGFPAFKSHVLWLEYMLCSMIYSSSRPRVLINYDNMLEHPEHELNRIATAINLSFDLNSPQFQDYKINFLSDSLRSTKYSIDDLTESKFAPSLSKDFYLLLKKIACDELSLTEDTPINTIEQINKMFIKDISFFNSIISEYDKFNRNEEHLREIEEHHAQLQAEFSALLDKNIFMYTCLLFKEYFIDLLTSKRLRKIQCKITRHMNSLFLIILNIKSSASFRSLHHEFFELLKHHRLKKSKQIKNHDGIN